MTTRYVHAKKGTTSGPFDTPAKPARTIADAIRVAVAGDTVEILDNATYREDELVVGKALTLVSSFLLAHPTIDPTDPKFDPAVLPAITTKRGAAHRVLRIAGTAGTRASFGPVAVRGVRVTGGHAVHRSADPALGAGGGIAVIDADNVLIECCVITGNQTETARITGWPEADRVALRNAVVGLVGEIVSPAAVQTINGLVDAANAVLKLLGRPPLPRLDRATILADLAANFDGAVPPGRPNSWLAGQAFGGGLATVWAGPTVRKCLIRGNTAQGRGAGAAVVGYGWPSFEHCWIDGNRSGTSGRRDGGGLGCEVSVPGKLTRDLSEIDLVRFFTAKVVHITSPTSSVTMSDLLDYAWWLIDPLRPNPAVRGVKAIVLELLGGKAHAKAVLFHALYFLAGSALSLHKWDAWKRDEIESAQKTAVKVTESRLTGNRCFDDGGGLYASVLSRVQLVKTEVSGNIAGSIGGGVRLTMGSGGVFDTCDVRGNTARGLSLSTGLPDPGPLPGGGVSARNSDVLVTATTIGVPAGTRPSTPATESNVTPDHPGGGVGCQADTEGALAGIPDLWTAIMREVFEVRSVRVEIGKGSTVAGNGAGYDERRSPVGKVKFAKGGGLFALQGTFPDAPDLTLTVEAVATTIHGNSARVSGYPSKVEPGLTIATADEVCLQNLRAGKEWTESNYRPLLQSGNLIFRT
ncbi:hypothetical protein AB0C38_08350 [Amycolatopsis sp. NPDC048633]|uniref:hypothetical protein n=1 Tax=Amycolatopsis sp. NPDC048633 TaxID=3157095 RepID=UPI0033D6C27D